MTFVSDQRTSSTHALTMYRYNYKIKDKTYKVGKLPTIRDFEQTSGTPRGKNRLMNCTALTTLERMYV